MVAMTDSRKARLRIGVGAAIVLVIVALAAAVLMAAVAPKGSTELVAPTTTTDRTSTVILVHVLGAVAAPGLYELGDDARAVDAVAAAGGFTDTADRAQLNLARFVSDGEQLYIPEVGELPPPLADGLAASKVNINTADASALDTLPRVGPATAAHIIDWREANGRFSAIEDLMSVPGIGEKTFDGLRDLVTV